MRPHIIFFQDLELIAYTPLDVVAILSKIGSIYGYGANVDIEESFDRVVKYD